MRCSWHRKMCVYVCVCVCVSMCEGLLQGALDKWRCHMVRPDVLVSYVHSSSKTTTSATIRPPLFSKGSQPICFLLARLHCILGTGYFFWCVRGFQRIFCLASGRSCGVDVSGWLSSLQTKRTVGNWLCRTLCVGVLLFNYVVGFVSTCSTYLFVIPFQYFKTRTRTHAELQSASLDLTRAWSLFDMPDS